MSKLAPTPEERERALKTLWKEGEGAWECKILDKEGIADVLDKPSRIRRPLMGWIREVSALPADKGALCFTCDDVTFNRSAGPYGILMLMPFAAKRPTMMMISGICYDCAMHDDLQGRVLAQIRKYALPGAEFSSQARH
jgi:hypothetical protein